MLSKVTYKSNHISLLSDSTMSSVLTFYIYMFYWDLKEKDHIRRKVKIGNRYFDCFDLPKIRVGWARATKIKLHSPNEIYMLIIC